MPKLLAKPIRTFWIPCNISFEINNV
jgi:hypothetical protein